MKFMQLSEIEGTDESGWYLCELCVGDTKALVGLVPDEVSSDEAASYLGHPALGFHPKRFCSNHAETLDIEQMEQETKELFNVFQESGYSGILVKR